MEAEDARLFARLRLVAIAMVASIVVIAVLGEYLLRTAALPGTGGPGPTGDALEVIQSVFVIVALGLVAAAQTIKHAVVAGKPRAMVAFVKAVIRNMHRNGDSYGPSVILIPIALSDAVAVLGLALLVVSGGGSRLVSYVFFLAGLASALAVLPDEPYGNKALEFDAAARRERG
jgi:hypothetical protein